MDRRDFFKSMLVTPLLTPIFLASKQSGCDELLLISDKPQFVLPILLEESGKWKIISGQRYSFSNGHPQKKALIQIFETLGWTQVSPPRRSDLSLSFHPLQRPTPSSFALVSSGKILDIRSRRLRSLWQEMNGHHPLSSGLTIASLRTGPAPSTAGETVRIYRDGQRTAELSLKKDREASFLAKRGAISVKIQGRKVWVPESSCPRKICCLTPPMSFAGERIVCAPNHILVEICGPGMVDTVIG